MTCPACGTQNPDAARFCNGCGAPLAAADAPSTQRKVVTVIFCDVSGSTSLGERLDPEAMRRLMAGYFATARPAIELGEELIVGEAERIGPGDDFVTGSQVRFVRGFVASERGDHERGIDLARRALAIVDDSDYVPLHAEFRVGLAEILLAAERSGEAEVLLTEAIALAAGKHDLVVVARAGAAGTRDGGDRTGLSIAVRARGTRSCARPCGPTGRSR